jgi:hypothetical protein
VPIEAVGATKGWVAATSVPVSEEISSVSVKCS